MWSSCGRRVGPAPGQTVGVDVTAELICLATGDAMFAVVSDLGTYGSWLEIVAKVEAAEPEASDPGPAWLVDLRGQLGPLRRTKRLRMVRALAEPNRAVRFERRELDGRKHSAWVLSAEMGPSDASSAGDVRLTMSLHYGGSLWLPVLDRMLAEEIERSSTRLAELVAR